MLRSERLALLQTTFPPLHWATLFLLGTSVLITYLMVTDEQALQFLDLLQAICRPSRTHLSPTHPPSLPVFAPLCPSLPLFAPLCPSPPLTALLEPSPTPGSPRSSVSSSPSSPVPSRASPQSASTSPTRSRGSSASRRQRDSSRCPDRSARRRLPSLTLALPSLAPTFSHALSPALSFCPPPLQVLRQIVAAELCTYDSEGAPLVTSSPPS